MTHAPTRPARQGGIAAVELAIIMSVMALLLPVTMYISRLLWSELVLIHATQASAATIAGVSLAELSTGSDADAFITSARAMVGEAGDAAHLEPMFSAPDRICAPTAQCRNMSHGTVAIETIAYVTEQHFNDPIFSYGSPDGSTELRIISTVPYANRPLAQ